MTRSDKRRYHYIYKTTCLVTGKHYYGMHSTDELEDGYQGSGTILSRSVKKHGSENHKVEILEFCDSREQLRERERQIIDEAALTDPMCMNLKFGGHGGFDHLHKAGNIQGVRNISSPNLQARKTASRLKYYENNPDKKQELLRKAVDNLKVARASLKENLGVDSIFTILNQTEEFQEKRKEKFVEIGHQQGEKNSQYGTCWINDGIISKKIKRDQKLLFLANGWVLGRIKH